MLVIQHKCQVSHSKFKVWQLRQFQQGYKFEHILTRQSLTIHFNPGFIFFLLKHEVYPQIRQGVPTGVGLIRSLKCKCKTYLSIYPSIYLSVFIYICIQFTYVYYIYILYYLCNVYVYIYIKQAFIEVPKYFLNKEEHVQENLKLIYQISEDTKSIYTNIPNSKKIC